MATVGYGDIDPTCRRAQIVVMRQILAVEPEVLDARRLEAFALVVAHARRDIAAIFRDRALPRGFRRLRRDRRTPELGPIAC